MTAQENQFWHGLNFCVDPKEEMKVPCDSTGPTMASKAPLAPPVGMSKYIDQLRYLATSVSSAAAAVGSTAAQEERGERRE